MAFYEYKGQHFELPDTYSKEQALAKIKGHVEGTKSTSNKYPKQYEKYLKDQEVPADYAPIPGAPDKRQQKVMSPEEFEQDFDKRFKSGLKDKLLAIPDVALTLGQNLGAGLAAAPYSAIATASRNGKGFLENYEDSFTKMSRAPSTEFGDKLLAESMGVLGALPAVGGYTGVLTGMRKVKTKPEPVAPQTQKTLDALKAQQLPPEIKAPQDSGAAAFSQMADRLEPTVRDVPRPVPEPSAMGQMVDTLQQQPARRAQEILAERQKQMELEVARQTQLDMNAAQRARQEQAPTGAAQAAQRAADMEMTARNAEIQERNKFFEQAKQDSIVEDYGNVNPMETMPNMRIDENGMPIRADLSMEAQNLQNPLQRGLFGDELPVRTGDGGVPMTQALDSMPPGPERQTAIGQLSGQGLGFKGQRGAVNLNDIGRQMARIKKQINPLRAQESAALATTGLSNEYIPQGDSAESIVAASLAKGVDGNLFELFQSGASVAGQKIDSPLLQGVGRWMSWAEKTGSKNIRDVVQPLERQIGQMSRKDLELAMQIRIEAMNQRKAFTPEQMKAAGVSDDVIALSKNMDAVYATVLKDINTSREKLGMKPITPAEAYFSSMWNGNYHLPIYEGNKLVGYVKTETRSEANKALAWLKKNHPEYRLPKAPEYKGVSDIPGVPRDFTDTFGTLMQVFKDTPLEGELSMLMENYKKEQAYGKGNFPIHFEKKANVRFFLGDRPWLSSRENAVAAAEAQVQYLKEASRWAPTQEMMATVKEVMSNPQLLEQQPNNVKLAQAYLAQSIGMSKNMFKNFESFVAEKAGVSPGTLTQGTNSLKTLMYLQQLGMSGGYAIATPLQALIIGPAEHLRMSQRGFKHNTLKSAANALVDTSAVLAEHGMGESLGRPGKIPMSQFAKEALRYMEDNGIISANLWDEYSNMGENKITTGLRNTVGLTISFPEKVTRALTFMSFVHHLKDSGMKPGLELFRAAEEATNNTLTNFSKTARPLVVDRMGLMGELAYTYQSPIVNYYNQLGSYARDWLRGGSPMPFFIAAIIMPAMLGGVMNVPGVEEFEGALGLFRDAVSKHAPQYYSKVKDLSVRELLLKYAPDVATYGSVSAIGDVQLASRLKTQAVNVEDPFGDTFPAASVVGNAMSIPPAIVNPTDANVGTALYKNLPPAIRGIVETEMDTFKAGPATNGKTPYYTPSKLSDRDVSIERTANEESLRKLGLYSLTEARTKDARFAANKAAARGNEARNASLKKTINALVENDQEAVAKYIQAYFENNGESGTFQRDLERELLNSKLTPEVRQMVRAKSLSAVMNMVNRQKLEGQ